MANVKDSPSRFLDAAGRAGPATVATTLAMIILAYSVFSNAKIRENDSLRDYEIRKETLLLAEKAEARSAGDSQRFLSMIEQQVAILASYSEELSAYRRETLRILTLLEKDVRTRPLPQPDGPR